MSLRVFFWLIFFPPYAFSAVERQPCGALYEPSGVIQLLDGRLLVVEDEKKNPMSVLTQHQNLITSISPLKMKSLADLEAVAMDDNGFIYAITSHSRTNNGKRSAAREKLVRFKVNAQGIQELGVLGDLRGDMLKLNKALKLSGKVKNVKEEHGFNIEGLSFDQHKRHLLIGLRSPVIDKKAVLLVLKNPKAVFDQGESPQFKKSPIYLDLDKGGIRSITFDPYLNGYLIISRHEKKGKKFKLWLWSGQKNQPPRRVRINGKLDFSNAEGITPVREGGGKKLMVVFDVGDSSKRKRGCYAFISYSQLKIEGRTQP